MVLVDDIGTWTGVATLTEEEMFSVLHDFLMATGLKLCLSGRFSKEGGTSETRLHISTRRFCLGVVGIPTDSISCNIKYFNILCWLWGRLYSYGDRKWNRQIPGSYHLNQGKALIPITLYNVHCASLFILITLSKLNSSSNAPVLVSSNF